MINRAVLHICRKNEEMLSETAEASLICVVKMRILFLGLQGFEAAAEYAEYAKTKGKDAFVSAADYAEHIGSRSIKTATDVASFVTEKSKEGYESAANIASIARQKSIEGYQSAVDMASSVKKGGQKAYATAVDTGEKIKTTATFIKDFPKNLFHRLLLYLKYMAAFLAFGAIVRLYMMIPHSINVKVYHGDKCPHCGGSLVVEQTSTRHL